MVTICAVLKKIYIYKFADIFHCEEHRTLAWRSIRFGGFNEIRVSKTCDTHTTMAPAGYNEN